LLHSRRSLHCDCRQRKSKTGLLRIRVSCLRNKRYFVAIKMGRGPFSSQPSGPEPVGCFSIRRPPISINLSKASAGECILSRRDSMIVARHEVPG
jgi:hypothetical protein